MERKNYPDRNLLFSKKIHPQLPYQELFYFHLSVSYTLPFSSTLIKINTHVNRHGIEHHRPRKKTHLPVNAYVSNITVDAVDANHTLVAFFSYAIRSIFCNKGGKRIFRQASCRGLYFYRLSCSVLSQTVKAMLLK